MGAYSLCLLLLVVVRAGSASGHVVQPPLTRGQLTAAVEQLNTALTHFNMAVGQINTTLQRLLAAAQDVPAECPHGWVSFQSHCYGFGDEGVTWGAALEICRQFGGSLVEVDSSEENNFLIRTARARGYDTVFLGATDLFSDGHWVWVSGRPVSTGFTAWYPGQQTGNDGGNQDCLLLHNHQNTGHQWHDGGCNNAFPFACEMSLA